MPPIRARVLSVFASLFSVATAVAADHGHLSARDVPVVDVGTAQYQGVYNSTTNVTSYWGIRFAASPTGQ
jgi:hypothetical protein